MTVEKFKRAEKIIQEMNELEVLQRLIVKLFPELKVIVFLTENRLEKLKNEFESL